LAASQPRRARTSAGAPWLQAALKALGLRLPGDSLQIFDASDPRPPDPTLPLLVVGLRTRTLARLAKERLMRLYPGDHTGTLLVHAGMTGKQALESAALHDVERARGFSSRACFFLPPISPEASPARFETLVHIMARLRAPAGCPWDRAQTHESIKGHLLEEAYEALEALDESDPAKLQEELGDLLMQIVLHAQMAREQGTFDISDITRGIVTKLIYRHPHVFAAGEARTAADVQARWHELKQQERAPDASLLDGVPRDLPALARSQLIQRRAANVGFEWPDLGGVLDKLEEELGELRCARTRDERRQELGDVLFVLVDIARWLDLDAEESLRLGNARFARRFRYVEEQARAQGRNLADLSFDEMNALWEQSKHSVSD